MSDGGLKPKGAERSPNLTPIKRCQSKLYGRRIHACARDLGHDGKHWDAWEMWGDVPEPEAANFMEANYEPC